MLIQIHQKKKIVQKIITKVASVNRLEKRAQKPSIKLNLKNCYMHRNAAVDEQQKTLY